MPVRKAAITLSLVIASVSGAAWANDEVIRLLCLPDGTDQRVDIQINQLDGSVIYLNKYRFTVKITPQYIEFDNWVGHWIINRFTGRFLVSDPISSSLGSCQKISNERKF